MQSGSISAAHDEVVGSIPTCHEFLVHFHDLLSLLGILVLVVTAFLDLLLQVRSQFRYLSEYSGCDQYSNVGTSYELPSVSLWPQSCH